MLSAKPLFYHSRVLPIGLLWLASSVLLSAETGPPKATESELAKASYTEEKKLDDLPTVFIDTNPNAEDGLAAGTLGFDGGEVASILQFANEIAAGAHGEVDSLLISHRGKLLFESYFRRGRVNYPHYQMSITKSYTALAIGRAIQCGHLTMNDLNRPVYEFLKELDPTRFAKGAATITLADVMTMRSGIRIPQNVQRQIRSDTANVQGQHQVQMSFERTAPIGSAPREFKYQGIDPAITMQVLEAVVPGTAQTFLKKELLEKLKITQFQWPDDINGLPKSAAGSSMRSRDMMKWGLLVRQHGQPNGEQLIPPEFMKQATSPLCEPSETNSYGFFFWQNNAEVGETKTECITCRGAGGQFIFFFPKADVIAVVTSHNKGMGPLLKTLPSRVLPSFQHDQ
jgi:CubicO group peptidase (beta-lactamase class C family)